MEKERAQNVIELSQLLPRDWTLDTSGTVWSRIYHAAGAYREEIKGGQVVWDLGEIRVIFVAGRISFPVASLFVQAHPTGFNEYRGRVIQSVAQDGVYCIVLTRPADKVLVGPDADEALSSAGGLVAALAGGRSIVCELVTDSSLDIGTGQGAVTLHARKVRSLMPVDTNEVGHARVKEALHKIGSISAQDAKRIRLSLRWFESGLLDDGADAFIKFWIAFEALTAREGKIPFLADCLGQAYDLPPREAKERFGVGRLYGLRKRIFHEGDVETPTPKLLEYLEALYADLLSCRLGLSFQRRAENALSTPGYQLGELLSS